MRDVYHQLLHEQLPLQILTLKLSFILWASPLCLHVVACHRKKKKWPHFNIYCQKWPSIVNSWSKMHKVEFFPFSSPSSPASKVMWYSHRKHSGIEVLSVLVVQDTWLQHNKKVLGNSDDAPLTIQTTTHSHTHSANSRQKNGNGSTISGINMPYEMRNKNTSFSRLLLPDISTRLFIDPSKPTSPSSPISYS